MKFHQFLASWHQPFSLAQTELRYQSTLKLQHSHTPLTPQDQFCAGGRYTVRGTDGRQSLCSDRGLLWRNEISAQIPLTGWQIFFAGDLARLHRSTLNLANHLVGAALGGRGALSISGGVAQIEVFIGTPLHTPASFQSAGITTGAQIYWQF